MNTHKSILRNTILVFLIGISVACSERSDSPKDDQELLDQVVLIIDKCPNYSQYQNPNTGVYSSRDDDFEITAINSDLRKLVYKTNEIPTRDTVVFDTKGQFLELDHIYKFHRYLSFRVQKGDTVLFTYDQDFPKATILNRQVSNVELNYEAIRNDYLVAEEEDFDGNSKFNISPISSVKGYLTLRDRSKTKQIRAEIYESALMEAKIELENERWLLDSLVNENLIDEETRSYYYSKSNYLYKFNEFVFNQYVNESFESSEFTLNDWPIKESQDLIQYGYYNRILEYIEREAFYSEVNWIEEVNRRYPDYRKVYDLISENDILDQKEVEILLAKNLKLIIEYFPQEDVDEYLNKFVSEVHNGDLVNGVLTEYQHVLSPELKEWSKGRFVGLNAPDSLMHLSLIDSERNQVTLKSLLEENEGQFVYIDFWASHCVPCFAAMPHSKELKTDYSNKQISFIYISIDKEFDNWIRGMEKAEIKDYPSSYMVSNEGMKNTLLETLKVNEIPRYMLFNQEGDLIQYRAFGPSTPEIREVFDRYF